MRCVVFYECVPTSISSHIVDDALQEAGIPNIPKGYPGAQDHSTYHLEAGDKTARIIGIKYTALKESSVDTIVSIRERFPSE